MRDAKDWADDMGDEAVESIANAGGDATAFIRAIQRDALMSAAKACDLFHGSAAMAVRKLIPKDTDHAR